MSEKTGNLVKIDLVNLLEGLRVCGSSDELDVCSSCPYQHKKECVRQITHDACIALCALIKANSDKIIDVEGDEQ